MGNIIFRMVGIGAFGVGLAGCSGGASEPVTQDCRAELQAAQGLSLQGFSAQGIQAQGLSVQGLSVQGLTAQGLSVQGLSPQGFSAQGFSAQGFSAQGISPQGLSPQGISAQGISPQGFSAQGLSPQGISAQGLSPQGISAQGISPQGLTSQGTALGSVGLQGVSTNDAARWLAGDLPTLPPDQVVFISLDRGVLSGRTAAGKLLRGTALTGLLLPFSTTAGETLWIGVTKVAPHADVADLPTYALELNGESLCEGGVGGVFVPGAWDESGAVHDSIESGGRSINSTFSCPAGVIEKCVVWGYRPWIVGAKLHETCTRMARADYCGNGVPHTENGTMIDMFDTHGIQTEVPNDGLSFEAGWGEDGAVCVLQPRYIDRAPGGEQLLPSCWADKPRCDTFSQAITLGAELANNSPHGTRVQFASPHCL